jgi:hypothetical protein
LAAGPTESRFLTSSSSHYFSGFSQSNQLQLPRVAELFFSLFFSRAGMPDPTKKRQRCASGADREQMSSPREQNRTRVSISTSIKRAENRIFLVEVSITPERFRAAQSRRATGSPGPSANQQRAHCAARSTL